MNRISASIARRFAPRVTRALSRATSPAPAFAIVIATAIVVAATGCRSGLAQQDGPRLAWSADTLTAELALVTDAADARPGRDVVLRPLNVRMHAGLAYIADHGAERVAVLDSTGRVLRSIGARGRGPGELLGVSHIAVTSHGVLVGEALNGRVSEFSLDGEYRRSYISPYAAGAVATSAARMVSASTSRSHYGGELDSLGNPRPVFPRARIARREARRRFSAMPGHDLIVSDSVRSWVFDQGALRLCRFDVADSPPRCMELPHTLATRLRQYRDDRVLALETATRLSVSVAPLAKDMVRIGALIAVLLPLPEMPIVLVDPDDGTLTPVMIDPEALPAWARGARSFAWDGRRFLLVSDEGIGHLYLSRRAPSSP